VNQKGTAFVRNLQQAWSWPAASSWHWSPVLGRGDEQHWHTAAPTVLVTSDGQQHRLDEEARATIRDVLYVSDPTSILRAVLDPDSVCHLLQLRKGVWPVIFADSPETMFEDVARSGTV
jgi:hypothetical protein